MASYRVVVEEGPKHREQVDILHEEVEEFQAGLQNILDGGGMAGKALDKVSKMAKELGMDISFNCLVKWPEEHVCKLTITTNAPVSGGFIDDQVVNLNQIGDLVRIEKLSSDGDIEEVL